MFTRLVSLVINSAWRLNWSSSTFCCCFSEIYCVFLAVVDIPQLLEQAWMEISQIYLFGGVLLFTTSVLVDAILI